MKTDSMTIDNKELNNGEATKEQTRQTPDTWQAYTKKTHVIGRTVSIITLVMLVGAPFLIGKLLGAYPDLGAVGYRAAARCRAWFCRRPAFGGCLRVSLGI